MKNIKIYDAEKYKGNEYEKVEENTYKTKDNFLHGDCYVTSLCFEQEPEFGEGKDSSDISQYPLEDILDKFLVAVEDFYEDKNDGSSDICYLEFSGTEINNIKDLLGIVGKHVYNEIYLDNEKEYVRLAIE